MTAAEVHDAPWPINGKCVPFFIGKGTVMCRVCRKELSEGLIGPDGRTYCPACVEHCTVCGEMAVSMTADGEAVCARHYENTTVCPRCGRRYGNDCAGVWDKGCQVCYNKPEGEY